MVATQLLELRVPANARSIGDARRTLASTLEEQGYDRGVVDGVRLAVTEAFTNAVRHAYPDDPGAIEVEASADSRVLRVVVRDHGRGMDARSSDPGAGLGFPIMRALASSVDLQPTASGGTEVRMEFLQP